MRDRMAHQAAYRAAGWRGRRPVTAPRGEASRVAGLSYGWLLIAVDGSESSLRAGEHAVYLAQSLGTELLVLGVLNVDMDLVWRTGLRFSGVFNELEEETQTVLRIVCELAEKSGVSCEELSDGGRAHRAVAQAVAWAAEEYGADCVVIGSSDTSDARGSVLAGGAYKKVLQEANCPVLSV